MDVKTRVLRKRILVVDDEPSIVETIKIRLEAAGYEVLSAYDGYSAIDKIRAEQPDLIILDVLMPRLDGFEVCRMIKFDKRFKDIPIIMLTGKALEEDKKTGFEVGANGFFLKPFDFQVLYEKIKELLKEE